MKDTNKKYVCGVFLICALMFFQACGSHSGTYSSRKIFNPQWKESLSNAAMIVEVKNDKFQRHSQDVELGVIMLGVLGGMIIDSKNQKYFDSLGELETFDYKGELTSALKKELDAIPWIEIKKTDLTYSTPWLRMSRLKRSMDLYDLDSALLVRADFKLSKNYKCLDLSANSAIYQKTDTMEKQYESQSKHSTCQEAEFSGDVYLKKWVKNNGALIKSEMEKGINKLASIIKMDLVKK